MLINFTLIYNREDLESYSRNKEWSVFGFIQNECLDSLLKDVFCVHPSVIFCQFDREDDAGYQ